MEKSRKPNSYCDKVLKQLNAGKVVTTDSIYQDLHTHDGRKVLSQLKNEFGIPIVHKDLPSENGRKPRREFWLDKSDAA